jgi:phosphonate transport system permease protein
VAWALLFVKVVGLGPLPAVLALGVAYGGLIGKVASEQMEDVAPRPVAALEAVGAGRAAAFAWGILPQAFPSMANYVAYRFECGVRASVLMGFVGAGGLGYELQVSFGDYLFGEVLTETAFLVAVVALIEWSSDILRRRLA